MTSWTCFAPVTAEAPPTEEVDRYVSDLADPDGFEANEEMTASFDEPLGDRDRDEQAQLDAMALWGVDARGDLEGDAADAARDRNATVAQKKGFWSSALYRFITNRKTENDFLLDHEKNFQ